MAKPYRLQAVEQEHNTPLEVLIPQTVNRLGSQKSAADELGISQATISTWLKENGYVSRTVYVKTTESEQVA